MLVGLDFSCLNSQCVGTVLNAISALRSQFSHAPSHLADGDDSILGIFVSGDLKHVHAISTDDSEIHLSVLPDVSVSGSNSPNWSARLG